MNVRERVRGGDFQMRARERVFFLVFSPVLEVAWDFYASKLHPNGGVCEDGKGLREFRCASTSVLNALVRSFGPFCVRVRAYFVGF